jgi:hypothetical protein
MRFQRGLNDLLKLPSDMAIDQGDLATGSYLKETPEKNAGG